MKNEANEFVNSIINEVADDAMDSIKENGLNGYVTRDDVVKALSVTRDFINEKMLETYKRDIVGKEPTTNEEKMRGTILMSVALEFTHMLVARTESMGARVLASNTEVMGKAA